MKRIILLLLLAVFLLPAFSQLQRPLTINDLAKWNRITEKIISNNGELAGFVIEPWEGDSSIELYEIKKDKKTFSNPPQELHSQLILNSDIYNKTNP